MEFGKKNNMKQIAELRNIYFEAGHKYNKTRNEWNKTVADQCNKRIRCNCAKEERRKCNKARDKYLQGGLEYYSTAKEYFDNKAGIGSGAWYKDGIKSYTEDLKKLNLI